MRLLELKQNLNEVTFSKLKIGSTIAMGDNAAGQALKSLIDVTKFNYNTDPLTIEEPNAKSYTVQVGKKPSDYVLALSNDAGQRINLTGSKTSIQDAFNHYSANKISNRGEVAEGLLGAAVFAKMLQRQGEYVGQITGDNIWRIIDQLKQTGEDTYSTTVPDGERRAVKDSITFTLRLKSAPYKDLMNPEKRVMLTDLISSAVTFANSKDIQRYSEYFYLNGKPDQIHVISDGVSAEEEQKTDVQVLFKDHATGQMRSTRLNISLKVGGVGQFGQVGGAEGVFALFGQFGLDFGPDEPEFERILKSRGPGPAMEFIYRKAAKTWNDILNSATDFEEYRYIKTFSDALAYFTTKNDPTVVMVDFDKGGFSLLRFNDIEGKLSSIQLGAQYVEEKVWPRIDIVDLNNPKNKLLQFRVKVESDTGYLRNIIEKGNLFSALFTTQMTQIKK
jgi:hypothetical protein